MMLTRGGMLIDPLDLDLTKITLKDVAWALCHVYRWGGHADPPVTVGEHTAACARYLHECGRPLEALAALHHDDGEAFLGDMCRELKTHPLMRAYREAEDKASHDLRIHFAPETEGANMVIVKEIDGMSLAREWLDRMHPAPGEIWSTPHLPLPSWCYQATTPEDWVALHRELRA